MQRLKKNGIMVAHITNRFVDLRPVIYEHALRNSLTPLMIDYESADMKFQTRWILLTRNENIIHSPLVTDRLSPWPKDLQPIRWTDDYASLASVLDWSAGVDWEKIQRQLQDAKNTQATSSVTK
jgi:hypothetical protein